MAGRTIAVAERDGGFLHTCWNENGHRMAAASADGSLIQVWDAVTAATATDSGSAQGLGLTAKWKADVGGPISKVVWAPLEYGDVLASCSPNGAISIWEEVVLEGGSKKTWRLTSCLNDVHSPVLALQFSASSTGLKLVVVFGDGLARIYGTLDALNLKTWELQSEFQNARTLAEKNVTHSIFGASVSWKTSTLISPHPAFVFGCNSTSTSLNIAKVWDFEHSHQRWFCTAELKDIDEADQPVNHVSWAPNIGRSYEMIAVASGSAVSIWTLKFSATDQERVSPQRVARLTSSNEEIWQAEWDMSGMTLATVGTSGTVRIWQANLKGEWEESTQYHRF